MPRPFPGATVDDPTAPQIAPPVTVFTPEGAPEPSLDDVEIGKLLAVFDGYFTSAVLRPNGELAVTIGVPYTHKYQAMPATDQRGTTFVMVVYEKPYEEWEWQDEGDGEMDSTGTVMGGTSGG